MAVIWQYTQILYFRFHAQKGYSKSNVIVDRLLLPVTLRVCSFSVILFLQQHQNILNQEQTNIKIRAKYLTSGRNELRCFEPALCCNVL
jgi:hypothetical protein